ncbi:MAG: OmpA family protein [Acetobacter sp.]|nr:OmpA family protein [Acetobacter sp.]
MRAAALLATPSRPESSVSSISHSISDFRDALFVTPRSGSKVLSVPHASLMSYGFPMRSVSYHGRDQSYGGFANVLYDFDLERLFGLRSIVTPFVGGGAGYLWQRYDDMGPVAAASITGVHGGFAWQGIAGVAFDTGISGLQITAQYRMIGQPGSFYNGSFNYGTGGGHANFDQRFNHQFIVGFRYAFHNQPMHITPPSPSLPAALAAAAAPAPVPARSYLVFFDWNQYALTSRARQIVVEAAHATTYVHTTRINVNGYTDSSAAPGPAGQKYNYALSVKRARSVEAELIRNGVPASEIVIRGYGDTNPLVPTGPNTREPQNRRVEIILHA